MGAHDKSKPIPKQKPKAQDNRRESNEVKKACCVNKDLAENNKVKAKLKDCTLSVREELYLKSLDVQKLVQEPCTLESFSKSTKGMPKVSEKQDSVMTSIQFQVQGDEKVEPTKNKQINEATKQSKEETKQEKGCTPPVRVNRISVIKLRGNPNNSTLQGKIGGVDVTLLVDTGATLTCLSDNFWQKLKTTHHLSPSSHSKAVESVSGQPLETIGETNITFQIQDNVFNHPAVVIRNLSYDFILGRDFLAQFICSFDLLDGTFTLTPKTPQSTDSHTESIFPFLDVDDVPTVMNNKENEDKIYPVHAPFSFILPPQTETIIQGKLDEALQPHIIGLINARSDLPERYSIIGAAEIVAISKENTVPVRLLNPTAQPVKIYRRTKLAELNIVDQDIETYEMDGKVTNPKKEHEIQEESARDYSSLPDVSKCAFTDPDKERLRNLLYNYRDIFAYKLQDLGRTSLVYHTIDTDENKPIKQRPYRTSPEKREEIDRQVKEMCDQNIAQPSLSPWASPVVLVKKKDGSMRFCVDYRKLNAVTKKDSFPLPLITEVLDSLNATRYYTSLDLKSGYWQIELDPNTKEKTAFVTHNGLYHFQVLPFGLTNSPATFQRLMGHILRGLEYRSALIYIDDIIIFSKTVDEHLLHLEEVFSRLRDANLKLNPKKCEFAKQELEYLGHIVTPQGIKPCPNKIKAVQEFPKPRNLKQLKSFLGLANYYRRFIKDFAKIAYPLHRLTKKSVNFDWSQECQEAFDKLKTTLISAPILIYPDFAKEFHLFVDASSTGIGMALAQITDDGLERVIAYNGRNFNNAEVNYSTTEREALALVDGIKKFQPYLHGRKFTVHTDHNALQWLMSVTNPVGRLARWSLLLQQFNFDIAYRSGKTNGNADGLSRRVYDKCELYTLRNTENHDTFNKIYVCQRRDRDLSNLIHYLETSELPYNDRAARKLLLIEDWFYIGTDGLLYRIELNSKRNSSEPISQLVIPESLRFEILSNAHDHITGGHLGTHKTYQKIRKRYWWRGMFKDTEHWCKSCVDCSMRKTPKTKLKAPLIPIPVEGAFDRVAVDVVGPLKKTEKGNRFILVFSDYLTRWPEAFALPNVEASTVARVLVDEIISRHGAPRTLLSDRGTNFLSTLVQEVCKIFKIQKLNTSSYHPQTDGLVERFNGTLIQSLSMYVSQDQTDWDVYIPSVLFAYRVSPSAATQETPFYLLYGRECRLPIDVNFLQPANVSTSVNEHRQRIVESVERSQNIARENIQKAQQKMKAQYDKYAKERQFVVGQKVWIYTPKTKKGLSRKLLHLWHGPYRLVEQMSPVHFFVRTENNSRAKFAVHVNRMKPYVSPDDRPINPPDEEPDEPYLDISDIPEDSFDQDSTSQDQPDEAQNIDQASGSQTTNNTETPEQSQTTSIDLSQDTSHLIDNVSVFAAEKIVNKRKRKGKVQYLIKWVGFPDSANTWEPEENILDERIIQIFKQQSK